MLTTKPARLGFLAFAGLLVAYFGLITLVSGWQLAREQFAAYWYFVLALAAGFGVQVGLYASLASLVRRGPQGTVVAATGATSAAAMVSCCTHYLVNVAPVLGATGLVSLASQYQVEFFWVGLAFNAAGVAYIATRLVSARKAHARCATT